MKKTLIIILLITVSTQINAQKKNAKKVAIQINDIAQIAVDTAYTEVDSTKINTIDYNTIARVVEVTDTIYNQAEVADRTTPVNEPDDDYFYRESYENYQKKKYSKALDLINKAIEIAPLNSEYYCFKTYIYSYQKDYENAIKTVEKALELKPDDAELYELKGNSLGLLNKNEEAIESYEKMLNLEKHNARYYNNYLSVLIDLRQFEKIIEIYQIYLQAIEIDNIEMKKNNQFEADIHFYASLAYSSLGDPTKSLELLNKSIALSPDYAGYYTNRGNLFSDQKNYTNALADFNKAINLDPDHALYYYNRGSAYLDLEKYNEALKDLKVAEKKGYQEDGLYQNMGATYKGLKKYNEALLYYKKAIEKNPENKEVLNNLAILYKDMGQKTESEETYKLAIASGVKTHIPLFNQGFDLMKKKEYNLAIPLFEKAISEKPNFIEPYNQLGICYNNVAKDSLALATYTQGIHIDKTFPIIYHNRANLYKKMGMYDAAEQDYLTALKLDPTMNTEYYSLAAMYMELSNTQLTQQYFNLATESGVSIVPYYIDYSNFLSRNKQNKKALEIAQKGIKLYPENYDMLINLGAIYSDLGEHEKNAETLKKAIVLDPEKAAAYYNLGNYYFTIKKDLKKAEANYLLSIAKNKTIMEAYLNLSTVYQDMGSEIKMMQTMDALIENFPDSYEAYYNRAEYLYRKGNHPKAIIDFEKSFQLMDAKTPDEKNGIYTINIEKSNKSLLKAQAYQLMEQYDKAVLGFETYIAFNTKDAIALNNYAYCLLEIGKPVEAQDNFEKAYQLEQQEIDILVGLIASNYLLQNKNNLKKYIRVIQDNFPEYKVNSSLPETLTNEGYFYTPKFIKIWKDAVTK